MSLNPAQREAVEYTQGPLLVLAGAGSGKTRVITEKISRLIRNGLGAEKIAAITFTNKAAREMRERVSALLKDRAEGLTVSTFHAMGLRLLMIEHAAAGLRRGFTIFDADDSAALLKDLAPSGITRESLEALRGIVSKWKNQGLAPEAVEEAAGTPREREAAKLYAAYQQRLSTFNAVDFDDLVRIPLDLLERNEDVVTRWRERLRYLLVDEYQDTNAAQYRLLRALAGPRGAITCVGDDDQSIYAWRGAAPENLTQLERDYPNLRVVKLEQNYRCGRRILRAANTLIANNPHLHLKKLWSEHPEGDWIRVLECTDADNEAERVAAEIVHGQVAKKLRFGDFAILYRGNHQSRALEKALRAARVPYHLSGGTSFFDRAEIKDLLAYLRLLVNPDDDAAFLRVVNTPRREIGSTTLERLAQLAGEKHLSLARAAGSSAVIGSLPARAGAALAGFVDLVDAHAQMAPGLEPAALAERLLTALNYEAHLKSDSKDPVIAQKRIDNLKEFVDFIRESQKGKRGIDGLAAQLALIGNMDKDDDSGNQVRLMTLHAAKGLEFPCVFLVGCEDGILPHQSSLDEGNLEEERRLMYVGITRAKHQLTLSYCTRRARFGETQRPRHSRFLDELPQDDLHWSGRDRSRDAEHSKDMARSHLANIAALLGD